MVCCGYQNAHKCTCILSVFLFVLCILELIGLAFPFIAPGIAEAWDVDWTEDRFMHLISSGSKMGSFFVKFYNADYVVEPIIVLVFSAFLFIGNRMRNAKLYSPFLIYCIVSSVISLILVPILLIGFFYYLSNLPSEKLPITDAVWDILGEILNVLLCFLFFKIANSGRNFLENK